MNDSNLTISKKYYLETLKNIKENIFYIRNKKKISQEKLAEKLGVSKDTILRLENYKKEYISFELILNISKLFNIGLDKLCFESLLEDK